MEEQSEKELINTLRFDETIRSDVNSFDSRKHLFDFGIDSDMSLNEDKPIPTLKEEFHQNISGMNVDLYKLSAIRRAKNNNKLITNRYSFWKQNWNLLLQCLQKNKTIAEEEPSFVSMSGIISNLFSIRETNTFFGLKFKGVIYLFKDADIKKTMENKTKKNEIYEDYDYLNFLYLITDRDLKQLNDFERNMRVDRIDLKENRLIVCYGIAANDSDGSPVDIRCRKELKFMSAWIHYIITDIPTFVRGVKEVERKTHNRNRRTVFPVLKGIEVIDIPTTYSAQYMNEWSPSKYFSYLDQSLEFIKSCVGSELELYAFEINSEDKTIFCFRYNSTDNSDPFLPDFYTQ